MTTIAPTAPAPRDDAARKSASSQSDALILEHLWLADIIARRFSRRGQDIDDLRQVARTGLVEAAKRFDSDRGAFAAFAASTIDGVLKRHFRDHAWLIRPPRQTQELAGASRRVSAELAQQLNREPTTADVAAALKVTQSEIRDAYCAGEGFSAVCFDALGSGGIGRDPSSDHEFARVETRLVVRRLLRGATPAELDLLRMRFVEQRTQSEIAATLHISQMQVSRLLARIFERFRRILGETEAEPSLSAAA